MIQSHLVRVGVMGQIGRFGATDGVRYPRRARVIVRTARGLEIGDVVSHLDANASLESGPTPQSEDGQLLRRMTVEDELLAVRLDKNRHEAFEACFEIVDKLPYRATLLDVEYLFDGNGLYFYFLGDVEPQLEARLDELARRYDAVAQLRRFAETLTDGCGPDCGTAAATGNGCDTCTSCAIADACNPQGTKS